MPQDNNNIALRCQNPHCGAALKLKASIPGKAMAFVCPKCRMRQRYVYRGIDSECRPVIELLGAVAPNPVPQPMPQAGPMTNPAANPAVPMGGGAQRDPRTPTPIPEPVCPLMGRLVKVNSGMFRRNEIFNLREGENIIGQRDYERPSTVSIDDKFMSRQSVVLEVILAPGGYRFKFTLKKAMNPAFFNGMQINQGFSRPIKFGDAFRIGITDFIFEGIDGSRKPLKR